MQIVAVSRHLSKLIALAVCLGAVTLSAEPKSTGPRIELTPRAQPDAVFEIHGLSADVLQRFSATSQRAATWDKLFTISVGAKPAADQPAMLGNYELAGGVLRFTPRFPLQRGVVYRATLNLSAVSKDLSPVSRTISIPKRTDAKPPRVTAVYPSSSKLPENLLKFYLHFSQPMSQGDSYRYLKILDESGKPVELPFLELPQELWNGDGTRLTVLFDPGRVKRGLVPRLEEGPVFVAGRKYTLVVDEAWPGADGQPLQATLRKTFQATPADVGQPDPQRWKIAPPRAGARAALSVRFGEPLDQAMLQRVLQVVGPDKQAVAGEVRVGKDETLWEFTPKEPWRAGGFSIRVATTLEDRAGNSIGRPFEVDLNKSEPRRVSAAFVDIPFQIDD